MSLNDLFVWFSTNSRKHNSSAEKSTVSGCRDLCLNKFQIAYRQSNDDYFSFLETRPKLRKLRKQYLTKEIMEEGCAEAFLVRLFNWWTVRGVPMVLFLTKTNILMSKYISAISHFFIIMVAYFQ